MIRKHGALCYSQPMDNLRDLLYTQASLTKALSEAVGEPVRIEVLREIARPCTPEEKARLNEPQLWQRDVVLRGSRPLILARTRLPLSQAQGALKTITDLGDRPLGEWLFNQDNLSKTYFHVDEIKGQRDAVYSLNGSTIWVQETFI